MHAAKHELLRDVDPTLRVELHEDAVRHGTTVDDLVSIARGRITQSAELALVAAKYAVALKDVVWPLTCPFCATLVEPRHEVACVHCYTTGCARCVRGKGCPTCIETQRVRIEKELEGTLSSREVAEVKRLVSTEDEA